MTGLHSIHRCRSCSYLGSLPSIRIPGDRANFGTLRHSTNLHTLDVKMAILRSQNSELKIVDGYVQLPKISFQFSCPVLDEMSTIKQEDDVPNGNGTSLLRSAFFLGG